MNGASNSDGCQRFLRVEKTGGDSRILLLWIRMLLKFQHVRDLFPNYISAESRADGHQRNDLAAAFGIR
jgi:hypothetical protein